MIAGVADTHAALWYLFGDTRPSLRVKKFIGQAATARQSIELSAISLAEIVYLVEKTRSPTSGLEDVEALWRILTTFLRKRRLTPNREVEPYRLVQMAHDDGLVAYNWNFAPSAWLPVGKA